MPNLDVYEGHGRFAGPDIVRVNGALLQAERIFINCGARACIPEIPGLSQVDYLSNSGMMEVDCLPEDPVIIGGNYTGPEFAHTSSSSRGV